MHILGAHSGGTRGHILGASEKTMALDGYLEVHFGGHILGTAFAHLPVCPFARLPLASEKTMVAAGTQISKCTKDMSVNFEIHEHLTFVHEAVDEDG